MVEVTRTERGWAGHYICAYDCLFRRNTLVSKGDTHIVVSTVGNYCPKGGPRPDAIGSGRYFETMAFMADDDDTIYHDADVSRELPYFAGLDSHDKTGKNDNDVDQMHEDIVNEVMEDMRNDRLRRHP